MRYGVAYVDKIGRQVTVINTATRIQNYVSGR